MYTWHLSWPLDLTFKGNEPFLIDGGSQQCPLLCLYDSPIPIPFASYPTQVTGNPPDTAKLPSKHFPIVIHTRSVKS